MTISPSRTRELNIGRICLRAYQLAGLVNEAQSLSLDKLTYAKDTLEMILDSLEAQGLRSRAVAFETVTMVSGQSVYPLSADVIDIVGVAAYIDPSVVDITHAGGEMMVIPITREDWQLQTAKDATGRPIQFFANRAADPVEMWVWPTPTDVDEGTIRLQVHRLAADSDNGANTMDLERFWVMYITWELAHHIAMANALNMGRVNYFKQIAMQNLETCKSYSAQKTASQMVVSHRTGWSRR